jgi:endonuclease-3 related protein
VDTYTRRIFSRHGFFAAGAPHEKIRSFLQYALPEDARLFNEYHALLVKLGKEFCRTRPNCAECPVRSTFEGFRRPADD